MPAIDPPLTPQESGISPHEEWPKTIFLAGQATDFHSLGHINPDQSPQTDAIVKVVRTACRRYALAEDLLPFGVTPQIPCDKFLRFESVNPRVGARVSLGNRNSFLA